MDETLEHSDSDSGESWTLLGTNPTIIESPIRESHDKDDDTDGISIISDSDHEIYSPYQKSFENFSNDICLNQSENSQYISVDANPPNFNNEISLGAENDFLGDNNKHRIYVHKRNKRLSTVLNIIVLGSVITAAGVAIGHMWGVKNDCVTHFSPSVNKILSNLYKLQEENAYLRNKLKELSHYQIQQKSPVKQHKRCKKVFEESLNNKNVNRFTKCVDDSEKFQSHFVAPAYEREFIADINKLKNVYKENKTLLDEEITSRLKLEKDIWKNNINDLSKLNNLDKGHHFIDKSESLKDPLTRVSYADSIKNEPSTKKLNRKHAKTTFENDTSKFENNKRAKDYVKEGLEYVKSDEELIKDDRYLGNKNKQEKKKFQLKSKIVKKVKRRNKYEQWEMKGGLLKDYDDFSVSSQEENNGIISEHKATTIDATINDDSKTECGKSCNNYQNKVGKQKKKNLKQANWYDNRVELRKAARQKVEQEMFGGTAPNTARWYFRRMQKREQCRSKDNNTFRKLNDKRDMNYKTKH